ncbi:hypothetical protein BC828DRAFT_372972, partial [Blastocladiella britannica]
MLQRMDSGVVALVGDHGVCCVQCYVGSSVGECGHSTHSVTIVFSSDCVGRRITSV